MDVVHIGQKAFQESNLDWKFFRFFMFRPPFTKLTMQHERPAQGTVKAWFIDSQNVHESTEPADEVGNLLVTIANEIEAGTFFKFLKRSRGPASKNKYCPPDFLFFTVKKILAILHGRQEPAQPSQRNPIQGCVKFVKEEDLAGFPIT